jgi:uncharacterized lipoprotein
MKLRLSGILLPLALVGCAFTPQAVIITTDVFPSRSTVGVNRPVALTVVDERPRQRLGTRSGIAVGAELTLRDDLAWTVRQALAQDLWVSNGSDAEGRELRVEIRNLDYSITQTFTANTLSVDFTLKGICIRGAQHPYEQLYRGDTTTNTYVVQDEKSNNRNVSAAVSKAINAVLQDDGLRACLVGA